MISIGMFRNTLPEFVPAGQVIFSAGETGTVMYVVSEGEVEIRLGSSVLEVVTPGSMFGEMALIDESPRSADAVAKTDCKVIVIDARRFQFLVQETPYFALQVMTIMAKRLRNVNSKVSAASLKA